MKGNVFGREIVERLPRRNAVRDTELCRICGYLRVNVGHERDPQNSPEGMLYFMSMLEELHAFVPSGKHQ